MQRHYAACRNAQEIFRYLSLVESVAKALPREEETALMLEAWNGLLTAHEAGKLLAGEQELFSDQKDRDSWRATLDALLEDSTS